MANPAVVDALLKLLGPHSLRQALLVLVATLRVVIERSGENWTRMDTVRVDEL